MAAASYGGIPFREQIEFFRRKLNLPTSDWTQIWQSDHDHSFVVAGVTRDDLLADFRAAVDRAIAEGGTRQQFLKDFDTIVAKYGWSYHGGRAWRSNVIYQTNLRMSYAAGRYRQLKSNTQAFPYWVYRHSDLDKVPRLLHITPAPAGWNGLTLPHDDPWWDTHFPPNGWGCTCYVNGTWLTKMAAEGKSGPDRAPDIKWETKTVGSQGAHPRTVQVPEGIDPGFGYAPGRDAWMREFTPELADQETLAATLDQPGASDAMPAPRSVASSKILPSGAAPEFYVNEFLSEFGLQAPDRQTLFEDVTGEYLVISDQLFRDPAGALKILKRGREQYVLLLADTLKQPDEIWIAFDESGRLRRRYIARWQFDDQSVPTLVVFDWSQGEWRGVTAFSPDTVQYLDSSARVGERIYRRHK